MINGIISEPWMMRAVAVLVLMVAGSQASEESLMPSSDPSPLLKLSDPSQRGWHAVVGNAADGKAGEALESLSVPPPTLLAMEFSPLQTAYRYSFHVTQGLGVFAAWLRKQCIRGRSGAKRLQRRPFRSQTASPSNFTLAKIRAAERN
jgi:hypothetical protein